ncbi:MAG: Uncharacterised protein [Cryomorphaceae bacterium]|nr:MAG: Uncharacterised protein [Cryomorphaceae bacterium]|tara:strand:+ start:1479 stop:2786 length:1308 start_codon:yes stop_codon:yes gene_type:complete
MNILKRMKLKTSLTTLLNKQKLIEMKNKLQNTLITLLICCSSLTAQNNQISLNSGYTNQSFFSMQNGEILNVPNDDWDLAFSTDAFSATIRINDGKGVELYTYHLGDTSSWNNINNSTPNILINPMYNSDTDWDYGAFDTNQTGGFDYGWGVYNLQTHHIIGDSLFLIKSINGNWKKLWLEKKASGEYQFKYANLDGTNEISQNVLATNYDNKRFVYFSLDNNVIMDREPISSDWDITFTKYITSVQGMPYPVTGVLSNVGIEVAQADNISTPLNYTDYITHSFEQPINTLGYDWKTYQGSYVVNQNRCYFVKDYQQNIWRLVFTEFDGTSTGNIKFNTELVSATLFDDIDNGKLMSIYPNPVLHNENITLVYDMQNENSIVTIYNLIGSEVYSSRLYEKGLNTHNIPSNKLKRGTYIISVNSNGKTFNERLIIN